MTQSDSEPVVLSERRGGVLVLTLNRPERLNAWSRELEDGYFGLLADGDRDPAVRAIVVTGAGRGFCAGGDMDELSGESESGEQYEPGHAGMAFPLSIRKPLIAAINGACAGLGLIHAMYCDVRFAAADAKLTTAFARLGLPAEYGCAWLLSRLVGPGRASDLLLSGRVFSGEEAGRMGLAEFVVPREAVLDDAVRYAREIVSHCSPWALAEIKEQLRSAATADFATAYDQADAALGRAFAQPDYPEGVASFIERREPRFPPLD